jgi:uncharacterized protein (TIGR03000 family)
MSRNQFVVVGALLVAVAVLVCLPLSTFAGPGGGGGKGGGGGGGRGGGGGGGARPGGGGGARPSGGMVIPAGGMARPGGGWNNGNWNNGNWNNGNWNRGAYYAGHRGYGWGYPYGAIAFGIGLGIGYGYGNAYYYDVYQPTYVNVVPYSGDNAIYTAPANAPVARPTPAEDRAYVTIQLPVNRAEVWIEGEKSVQDKASQEYVSPQLTPGKKYYYEVSARWVVNGKQYEAKRSFPILPGKPVLVDFTEPAEPPSDK